MKVQDISYLTCDITQNTYKKTLKKENRPFSAASSAILPGTGQILNGQPVKGLSIMAGGFGLAALAGNLKNNIQLENKNLDQDTFIRNNKKLINFKKLKSQPVKTLIESAKNFKEMVSPLNTKKLAFLSTILSLAGLIVYSVIDAYNGKKN